MISQARHNKKKSSLSIIQHYFIYKYFTSWTMIARTDSGSILADSFSLVTCANAYFAVLKHNAGCFCHQSCKLTHNTLHQLYQFQHSLKSFQSLKSHHYFRTSQHTLQLLKRKKYLLYPTDSDALCTRCTNSLISNLNIMYRQFRIQR